MYWTAVTNTLRIVETIPLGDKISDTVTIAKFLRLVECTYNESSRYYDCTIDLWDNVELVVTTGKGHKEKIIGA